MYRGMYEDLYGKAREHAMTEYRENHFGILVDISLRTGQRI